LGVSFIVFAMGLGVWNELYSFNGFHFLVFFSILIIGYKLDVHACPFTSYVYCVLRLLCYMLCCFYVAMMLQKINICILG